MSFLTKTLFQSSCLLALLAGLPAAEPGLLPPGWDPALAGDIVMKRLINTSTPQVKGAHDAEMAIVDGHAYIVAEVNEVRAGESAGWPEIYAVLSIVDLKTLKVEDTLPIARTEQVFENVTLPVGACFVPRIIVKDATTLRCYFASEDPGKRQSQTWYRDFDLGSRTFAPTLHKVRLKTAAGTFDMEPQHFHTDAAAQGFTKPARDAGLFIFDSFKVFDGRTYVAINNFPGKQNALAVMNEALDTVEIIGHYNEPQTVNLSESAVNRLPDGTWMAICRQDGGNGNYHLTTSADGRTWTPGQEQPFVTGGANSKPTFDKFGGLYYLGWQEATRIHEVSRSVFNVDVSADGRTWQRKYRFETPHSFQYPTFREHEGVVWLCVTQGDTSSSRKERIMFGKLEDVGAFEPQAEQKRISWPPPPAPPGAGTEVLKQGTLLFTDRKYEAMELPAILKGRPFLRGSISKPEALIVKGGTLYALTPTPRPEAASREKELLAAGFEKMDLPEFALFPGEINRVSVYQKSVKPGERLRFKKMVVFVSDGNVTF